MTWNKRRTAARALLAAMVAGGLVVATAGVAEAAYARTATRTWGTNGTVFSLAVQGDVVYLGGKFTRITNPVNGQSIASSGVAALDRTTGQPVPGWRASVDGVVRSVAVSSDGGRLFVGGDFTTVNGSAARSLTALNPATGDRVGGWNASAAGMVRDMAVVGGDLYVGGKFSAVNGTSRPGAAKLDAGTGALVAGWNARVSGGRVWSVKPAANGQDMLLGGNFQQAGGAARSFLTSVSLANGSATGFAPRAACGTCYVWDIDTEGSSVYAAMAGPGGRVVAYNGNGVARWSRSADGNVQAVTVADGIVYAGGHFDPRFAGQTRRQLAALRADNGALDPFAPRFVRPRPGIFAIVATPRELLVGGGFSGIDNVSQPRFARFPVS